MLGSLGPSLVTIFWFPSAGFSHRSRAMRHNGKEDNELPPCCNHMFPFFLFICPTPEPRIVATGDSGPFV
jgi:hypothetical protein